MKLTRYLCKDEDGNYIGIAQAGECDDFTLEELIMSFEDALTVHGPYPENSTAFFTPNGLTKHDSLIACWVERCEFLGFEVKVVEREYPDASRIVYEDEDQVLIKD